MSLPGLSFSASSRGSSLLLSYDTQQIDKTNLCSHPTYVHDAREVKRAGTSPSVVRSRPELEDERADDTKTRMRESSYSSRYPSIARCKSGRERARERERGRADSCRARPRVAVALSDSACSPTLLFPPKTSRFKKGGGGRARAAERVRSLRTRLPRLGREVEEISLPPSRRRGRRKKSEYRLV